MIEVGACQCADMSPCIAPITAEDLLCDACRAFEFDDSDEIIVHFVAPGIPHRTGTLEQLFNVMKGAP